VGILHAGTVVSVANSCTENISHELQSVETWLRCRWKGYG